MRGAIELAREDVDRVAAELRRSCTEVAVVRDVVAGCGSSDRTAGRDHGGDGAAVQAALEGLAGVLDEWSRSGDAVADAVTTAVAALHAAQEQHRADIEAMP